jgi:hypothetical protein
MMVMMDGLIGIFISVKSAGSAGVKMRIREVFTSFFYGKMMVKRELKLRKICTKTCGKGVEF